MTSREAFEEAVARVKRTIESFPTEPSLFQVYSLDSGVLLATTLQDDGYLRLRKDPDQLRKEAEHDENMFKALRYGLAKTILRKEPLPEAAASWLVAYLQDRIEAPKAKRGRKSSTGVHIWVHFMVEDVVKQGLIATRNDEPSVTNPNECRTACDAVAKALKESGSTVTTYKAVKKIWEDVRKLRHPQGTIEVQVY